MSKSYQTQIKSLNKIKKIYLQKWREEQKVNKELIGKLQHKNMIINDLNDQLKNLQQQIVAIKKKGIKREEQYTDDEIELITNDLINQQEINEEKTAMDINSDEGVSEEGVYGDVSQKFVENIDELLEYDDNDSDYIPSD